MQADTNFVIPDAEQFRKWLQEALQVLDVTAHRLGELSGANKNAARKFLSRENADMRLATASKLVKGAKVMAAQNGVSLPDLPRGAVGQEPAE